MALKKYKPTSPAVASWRPRASRRSRSPSRRSPCSSRSRRRAGGTTRPHHDAPPGRRPQAPLPHDRLQAHEGRRAGQGGGDRVRPEPLGAHRAPALRRRREGLHPRPRGCGSARRSSPDPTRTSSRATRCRSPTSRRERSSTTSSSSPARARMARSAGSRSSSSPRTARTPCCGCRPASCAASSSPAATVARSGTPTTRTSRAARRPEPLARQAADRARLGHEPGRPPARRRRGQVEGRPPPGHPVGRPDARQAHAPQAQGIRQADRPRPRGKEKRR